ncbi:type 4b pilus protein PilO2, partial [Salmonella enterica subsp. enterica serovar Lubbock]|nr:type 4b pilus protein PilO2 [Salmonella enterica subsp. enterica serovar Lubbock]
MLFARGYATGQRKTPGRRHSELPHPWASQPVISDFLKACADLRKPSPVALEGWKLTGGTCTP